MSSEILITPVPPNALIARWEQCEPLFARSMLVKLGQFTPVDILDYCIRGQFQPWFVLEGDTLLALAITRIDLFPRKRVFSVVELCGKGMRDWFGKMDEVLTEYSLRNGCHQFMCAGRPGWKVIFGQEPTANFFVKELSPESSRTMNGGAMG